MGIEGWYMAAGNNAGSSYTEFNKIRADRYESSYTDFTLDNRPVMSRTVRRPAVNVAAFAGSKKKSFAGRKVLCVIGALAIVTTAVFGTRYYMDNNSGNNNNNIKQNGAVFEAGSKTKNKNTSTDTEKEEPATGKVKDLSDKTFTKNTDGISYSKSDPAYKVAENIMSSLWRDNDVDTAREIFEWVHSNVYYQAVTSELSFEEAAYRGFTRKSGDCYVYFACAKMLLDCAGIPNMMVERYPVYTNGHYWNLVQLDGEWYHCDATVFKDHPALYFMCTDDEIADDHHSFDHSRYPERASSSYYYPDAGFMGPGANIAYADGPYTEYYEKDYSDFYEDYTDDYYEDYGEDYSDDYSDDYYEDDFYDEYTDDYYEEDYSEVYVSEWD